MLQWIKCLFTGHDLRFVRNIYGDEIVHSGAFKRSWWKCEKCGAERHKPDLHRDEAGKPY
jgi:hypothetical protein